MSQPVPVIVSAARTPIGSFMGAFSDVAAPELGATAIKGALEKIGLAPNTVDLCIMGNVLGAGVGQAPARQAAIKSGLPVGVDCLTINKVCGSGMKAVMMAADQIRLGQAEVVVAGGMENMTQSPYLLRKARAGYRMGNDQLVDSMVMDGLWDVYNNFHMGSAAEMCVDKTSISREEQDKFSQESTRFAQEAIASGKFKDEIVPVTIKGRKGEVVVDTDEGPGNANPDKIPGLRPAFKKDGGTVTAGNASSINDGGAALVIMSEDRANALGLKVLAKVSGYATNSIEPEWFTLAPVGAIQKVLKATGHTPESIDYYEINEAFAIVTLAAMKEFNLGRDKVNVRGGAVALGHPIGCSGARILVTLLHTLISEDKKAGLAALCIGGGEGVAMVIER